MAPKSAFTKRGTLKLSWLKKASKSKGILGKRARLALNLKKISSKRSRRSRRSRKFGNKIPTPGGFLWENNPLDRALNA